MFFKLHYILEFKIYVKYLDWGILIHKKVNLLNFISEKYSIIGHERSIEKTDAASVRSLLLYFLPVILILTEFLKKKTVNVS